ncbi:phospholipase D-like domain-containing protein [Cognatilysobacter bugurensis]|uniref:phospholipase D-like domain-containing protein n=1 Tax=Cognatilysobacter bugurensis TaxID=543356 RepID=UPI0016778D10|nr:phospholipase D-like domain-containing protein [Lysobacter bugurensis]
MLAIIVATAACTALLIVIAANFSTPEKNLERKIEHRYGVADEQYRREMSVLLGPAVLPGNRITPLHNGDEIFAAMLDGIRSAQKTITFETYIYWSGEIGDAFADALAERARAGVKVHVTLDWAGSIKMDNDLLERMRDAGVQVHHYRPLRWYNLGRLNNRTHRKLLVIDGRLGFTGGVGVADQWLGDAQSPDHWRDIHFRVEGPVVAQLQAAFNDNWMKTTGEVLNGAAYFPPLAPVGDTPAHLFIASPAGGSESMHLMYLMAIAAADETIDLAASYFVPDELITRAFIAARHRGVRVRVLLPGPHIDSVTVRFSSKASWGPLLLAGVEVYEYQPTMLHAKLLIVDEEMVSVGSTNFDIRSFRLNDEASLNMYDADFAARMTRTFEADLKNGQPYLYQEWDNRSLRHRVVETLMVPLRTQL